jgi:predicted N-acetyltransferase YhbS
MVVRYLSERPDKLPTVARWLFEQFGHLSPGASIERSERRMAERLSAEGCPVAFVCLDGEVPTGTASLVMNDLEERPHLSPWLAGLYVEPTYRRRGIGAELVHATLNHAKRCGYDHLYLFTPNKQSFFTRLGWRQFERLTHHSVDVSVMSYNK